MNIFYRMNDEIVSPLLETHVFDHLHSRSFINLLFAQQSASAPYAALLRQFGTPFHFLYRSAPSVELFKKHLKTLYFTAITS